MTIDPSTRTHAQNRFLRRLNNRERISESPIGPRGSPIPGALTPTEIAHKARRRAKRLREAKENLIVLPSKIEKLENLLAHHLSLPVPHDSKELAEHLKDEQHLRSLLSTTIKLLATAQRRVSRLS